MSTSIEPWRSSQVELLVGEARRLDSEILDLHESYSGLLDIDLTLRSAILHFKIVNLLLRSMEDIRTLKENIDYHALAQHSASMGVMRLEEVSAAEKAGDDIKETEQYLEAEGLFHDLILAGGGALLDGSQIDSLRQRRIADAICTVLSKFAAPDDSYESPISLDNLPSWLQKVTAKILPSFVRSKTTKKLGIDEGEEYSVETEVVRMPLSQAIFYYEEELLPQLYESVAIDPGDSVATRRIEAIEARLTEYRKMKFIPRSTPLILPHGYYTDGIAGYTAEGELLVSVPLKAEFLSGTNTERTQYLVQSEIVRKLAGKGISEELDSEYAELKSLSSGLRGNRRTPGYLLDGPANFRKLKGLYPGLRMIDNRYQFNLLIEAARKKEFKKIRKAIEGELQGNDGAKLLEE